jgi:hypothetical protein
MKNRFIDVPHTSKTYHCLGTHDTCDNREFGEPGDNTMLNVESDINEEFEEQNL